MGASGRGGERTITTSGRSAVPGGISEGRSSSAGVGAWGSDPASGHNAGARIRFPKLTTSDAPVRGRSSSSSARDHVRSSGGPSARRIASDPRMSAPTSSREVTGAAILDRYRGSPSHAGDPTNAVRSGGDRSGGVRSGGVRSGGDRSGGGLSAGRSHAGTTERTNPDRTRTPRDTARKPDTAHKGGSGDLESPSTLRRARNRTGRLRDVAVRNPELAREIGVTGDTFARGTRAALNTSLSLAVGITGGGGLGYGYWDEGRYYPGAYANYGYWWGWGGYSWSPWSHPFSYPYYYWYGHWPRYTGWYHNYYTPAYALPVYYSTAVTSYVIQEPEVVS